MTLLASSTLQSAWPDQPRRPARIYGRRVAIAAGLAAAVAVLALVPNSVFRARAVVAVADPNASSAPALLKAAADAAVSKPVMSHAAESLIGTNIPVPGPGFIERLGVAFGWDEMHPTNGHARLTERLATSVSARLAETPGALEIVAEYSDADQSARVATAVAQALVGERDVTIAQTRRQRDIEAGERLSRLKAVAGAARRRFTELGGSELDPVQVRAAAAAQVAAAQARVDILHAIIASGSPPLSDRRDVSPSIDALQTSYLDLSRQLAKAQETLGDRHTTIISLREELRRAGASLTAEWRRLAKLADTELAMARERVTAASRADATIGPNGRTVLGDARVAMQMADERVARLEQGMREVPEDERFFRLLAPASVPSRMTGVPTWARLAAAALAGLAAFMITGSLPSIGAALDRVADRRRKPVAAEANRAEDVADTNDGLERARPVVPTEAARAKARAPRRAEPEITPDMDELLERLSDTMPEAGSVLTVLVAANEPGLDTTADCMSLGRAAAAAGKRVLIVEAGRGEARLAAHVDEDADPFVIDLFGTLRVALAAEAADGDLCLAPALSRGKHLASNLAARWETRLVEDIADDFDLLLIDGGVATDAAIAGWGADAFLRVGTRLSAREDERFAETFGVPYEALIGTLVASRFTPAIQMVDRPRVKPVAAPPARSADRALHARSATPPRSTASRAPMPRRQANGR